MARGLAKRNRPMAVAAEPLPSAVEDGALPELEPEDPESQPEYAYKKSSLPTDKIAIHCADCGKERAMYVDDASVVDEIARKEMFEKNGSYNPPLCGFCFRARQQRKQKNKVAA